MEIRNKTGRIRVKAIALDKKFDNGGEILHHFNLSKARRPGLEQKRVNVDFPIWMIQSFDCEAQKRGVTRQSLIKMWLAEKLETTGHPAH